MALVFDEIIERVLDDRGLTDDAILRSKLKSQEKRILLWGSQQGGRTFSTKKGWAALVDTANRGSSDVIQQLTIECLNLFIRSPRIFLGFPIEQLSLPLKVLDLRCRCYSPLLLLNFTKTELATNEYLLLMIRLLELIAHCHKNGIVCNSNYTNFDRLRYSSDPLEQSDDIYRFGMHIVDSISPVPDFLARCVRDCLEPNPLLRKPASVLLKTYFPDFLSEHTTPNQSIRRNSLPSNIFISRLYNICRDTYPDEGIRYFLLCLDWCYRSLDVLPENDSVMLTMIVTARRMLDLEIGDIKKHFSSTPTCQNDLVLALDGMMMVEVVYSKIKNKAGMVYCHDQLIVPSLSNPTHYYGWSVFVDNMEVITGDHRGSKEIPFREL